MIVVMGRPSNNTTTTTARHTIVITPVPETIIIARGGLFSSSTAAVVRAKGRLTHTTPNIASKLSLSCASPPDKDISVAVRRVARQYRHIVALVHSFPISWTKLSFGENICTGFGTLFWIQNVWTIPKQGRRDRSTSLLAQASLST